MMPRLICCCGVGGTGKTETMKSVMAQIHSTEATGKAVFMPSIVREYYALRGVANEIEYLTKFPPEQRFDFQVGLIDYYLDRLEKSMEALPLTIKYLFMDRSVFDHIGYCIYSFADMTMAQLDSVLFRSAERFNRWHPRIYHFPYPVSWSENVEDGFRATAVGKNWTINAMMLQAMNSTGTRFTKMPEMSIEERARFILSDAGIR